jgi:hypothetical protein
MQISPILVINLLAIFKAFTLILICLKPLYTYAKVIFDLQNIRLLPHKLRAFHDLIYRFFSQ